MSKPIQFKFIKFKDGRVLTGGDLDHETKKQFIDKIDENLYFLDSSLFGTNTYVGYGDVIEEVPIENNVYFINYFNDFEFDFYKAEDNTWVLQDKLSLADFLVNINNTLYGDLINDLRKQIRVIHGGTFAGEKILLHSFFWTIINTEHVVSSVLSKQVELNYYYDSPEALLPDYFVKLNSSNNLTGTEVQNQFLKYDNNITLHLNLAQIEHHRRIHYTNISYNIALDEVITNILQENLYLIPSPLDTISKTVKYSGELNNEGNVYSEFVYNEILENNVLAETYNESSRWDTYSKEFWFGLQKNIIISDMSSEILTNNTQQSFDFFTKKQNSLNLDLQLSYSGEIYGQSSEVTVLTNINNTILGFNNVVNYTHEFVSNMFVSNNIFGDATSNVGLDSNIYYNIDNVMNKYGSLRNTKQFSINNTIEADTTISSVLEKTNNIETNVYLTPFDNLYLTRQFVFNNNIFGDATSNVGLDFNYYLEPSGILKGNDGLRAHSSQNISKVIAGETTNLEALTLNLITLPTGAGDIVQLITANPTATDLFVSQPIGSPIKTIYIYVNNNDTSTATINATMYGSFTGSATVAGNDWGIINMGNVGPVTIGSNSTITLSAQAAGKLKSSNVSFTLQAKNY